MRRSRRRCRRLINGHLVVDIGGVHGVTAGSVTLTTALMDLGSPKAVPPVPPQPVNLVVGGMYEFAVFQAERHTSQSNYKLTLNGFIKERTQCVPICGDGIKTKTEVCDDGVNTGAYGKCAAGCVLGPYCGDKLVQNPPEACDDGVNLTSWALTASAACGPSCQSPSYCGDAIVQGAFGEKCDNGTANNTGGYGQCKSDCTLGPRCGDAITQAASGEACDNGFNLTSYVKHPTASDCAPTCKKPRSCGDGAVDFPFEQCDNGAANTNTGAYGACTLECVLGARCGDGVKNGPEQCDDGNRVNGDGCSARVYLARAVAVALTEHDLGRALDARAPGQRRLARTAARWRVRVHGSAVRDGRRDRGLAGGERRERTLSAVRADEAHALRRAGLPTPRDLQRRAQALLST